jgi:transcriptional regulator with XRE-family HTH domain
MIAADLKLVSHVAESSIMFSKDRMVLRRIELGLNQTEAAAKAEIGQSMWSSYEQGGRTPNADTLAKIAYALSCSTDWLLGLSENIQDLGGLSEDEKRVLAEYRSRRMALEREILNEKIDKLAKPLRTHIERLIHALQVEGKFDSRSKKP